MSLSKILPIFGGSFNYIIDFISNSIFTNFEQWPWMKMFICTSLGLFTLDFFVKYRQIRHCSKPYDSKRLSAYVNEKDYNSSASYEKDSLKFSMVSKGFELFTNAISYTLFLGPMTWNFIEKHFSNTSIYQKSIIIIGIELLTSMLTSIPFDLYRDFVIEKKYGFNNKTLKIFFKDLGIQFLLYSVLSPPIISLYIYLTQNHQANFFFYLSLGFNLLQILMYLIAPTLIMPLFNKYEPIKDEVLKEKIIEFSKSVNFPVGNIYQVDGSKRSNHSNAFFYGLFGVKMIVLYDTILDQKHEHILAILAHEIGHWKHSHLIKGYLLNNGFMLFIFYCYSKLISSHALMNSFGYPKTASPIIDLALFLSLCDPIFTLYSLIMRQQIRSFEYQADKFAFDHELGDSLKEALLKITTTNYSLPEDDPIYSIFNEDHPSLIERVDRLNFLAKEKQNIQKKKL